MISMIAGDGLSLPGGTTAVIGKFDGFHRGHQALLREALEMDDPVAVVRVTPDANEGKNLLVPERASAYLEKIGVSYDVQLPLTEETRTSEPERFVKDFLVGKLRVRTLVTGSDFRFGKDRAGTVETLKDLSEKYGFRLIVLPKLRYEGEEISSSRIREALRSGDMETAAVCLGAPYMISGTVLRGRGVGKELGFPTANLDVPETLFLPRYGVYRTRVRFHGEDFDAITNIGVEPTFTDEKEVFLESHILNFHREIYDEKITVSFIRFLREERRFSSREELIRQIEDNIFMMDQLTTILHEDGYREVLHQVLKGLDPQILAEDEVQYKCTCSRERITKALQSAGEDALRELAAEAHETEVTCQFCRKQYLFTPEELLALC